MILVSCLGDYVSARPDVSGPYIAGIVGGEACATVSKLPAPF